ncbi:PREDICTED: LOW QUALITY PROTEIN: olfactory receptor 51F2-like [Miniopterus natalensis]|uniref:LOW QUALITY PROTEIN: olfactory receptor 51F2-like n=1 Tax=Miniopterus natalensis TaxID=291302 RepID=UPI0007A72689|nr:PREDICTED: LOW QUALITY PROTEIN: olfactory receptor 51F2-like [Miniopterus natalensis]
MLVLNNTNAQLLTFLLTGIPGLRAAHAWISIPFCLLYVIALSGNSMILFVVLREQSLHETMYYFLSMLSATDLSLSLCTLSTTLGVFWFEAREINLNACIVQMFFLHAFTFMESGVLLAMAFDRFVAICDPLRYTTILTNAKIAQIGVSILVRNVAVMLPVVLLVKRLSFCRSLVLSHSYCYHVDLIQLSCADNRISSILGLFALFSTAGFDCPCILLSYVLIIRSVLNITSSEGRQKAFNTCISHISAVAIFYVPLISLSLVHRYGRSAPPFVHTIMANVFLLVPPVLNPIIYSVKTKQIQQAIVKVLMQKQCKSNHQLSQGRNKANYE